MLAAITFIAVIAIPLNIWYHHAHTAAERRALDKARNPGDW